MDLSVCIVNWNTRDLLRACLKAVLRQLEAISPPEPLSRAQVIVVDNASPDDSAGMVRREFPQVTLIANEDNRYYAAASNQALRQATGEYVLLLNPDVELQPGALAALVDRLRVRPDAGAVGCQLIRPDGAIQASCRAFPEPWPVILDMTGLRRLLPRSRRFGAYRMTYFDHDHEREVDQPMASCLLLRRAALTEVGPFDEDFPMFFNDVDLCYRLKAAGWRIWFTPKARATHQHAAATRQAWPAMLRQSLRGFVRFYHKHYRGRTCSLTYGAALGLIYAAYAFRILWAGLGGGRPRASTT